MSKCNEKIKLLVLYKLLCKYTDKDHSLSTGEIMALLSDKGIEISRNTIYDNIRMLNEYGYEVLSLQKDTELLLRCRQKI